VLVFALAVMFLARTLGTLYLINNVNDKVIRERSRRELTFSASLFVVFFVAYLVHLLLKDGYAYDAEGIISIEAYKYLHNLTTMWYLALLLLLGVALVLFGIVKTVLQRDYTAGIWPTGIGTVVTVLALLLTSAWNHTAYYPSTADLQSSLTIENSSSSYFTLNTMFWVSLLIPFVLAYIVYAWRKIDSKKIDREEMALDDHAY